MPDWNFISTAFLVTLAVVVPIFFVLFIFLQIAIGMLRLFVSEVLASDVVQALAGAAESIRGKSGAPGGGSVKSIVASKGMDIVGRILGMG